MATAKFIDAYTENFFGKTLTYKMQYNRVVMLPQENILLFILGADFIEKSNLVYLRNKESGIIPNIRNLLVPGK